MSPTQRYTLLVALVLGLLARIAAVPKNADPHGDVHLDLLTLESLWSGEGFRTPLERSVELQPVEDAAPGYPSDQHPPLALLLALPFAPLVATTYDALRAQSFAAGLLLVAALYLLARRLYDRGAAATAATAGALSFLLADFAGNGSIYTLHALCGVLAVAALARGGAAGALLAGGAAGLAYLANYQALVFLPALCLALLAARGPSLRARAGLAVLAAAAFAAVASAWWVRNALVFGDPTFSVNPLYLKQRLGAPLALEPFGATSRLALGPLEPREALVHAVKNLVVNVRFLLSQSALWFASCAALAAAGAAAAWRAARAGHGAAHAALVLLPLAHLLVSLAWPAAKLRYLVPLAPFAVLLAVGGLRALAAGGSRRAAFAALGAFALVAGEMLARGRAFEGCIVLAAVAVALLPPLLAPRPLALLAPFALLQAVLVAASPTRTTYNDGILIADQFKRTGAEAADRVRQTRLRRAAGELLRRDVRAVIADVELAAYGLAQPEPLLVVQEPQFVDAESFGPALRRALTHFGVRHVLATSAESLELYRGLAGFEAEEWRDDSPTEPFALLRFAP